MFVREWKLSFNSHILLFSHSFFFFYFFIHHLHHVFHHDEFICIISYQMQWENKKIEYYWHHTYNFVEYVLFQNQEFKIVIFNTNFFVVFSILHFIFIIQNQQLRSLMHNALKLTLLILRDKIVRVNLARFNLEFFFNHRSLYINVVFIQSRDRLCEQSCSACQNARNESHLFSKCQRLVDHFNEACVNCKWRDHVNRCFVQDEEDDVCDEASENENESDEKNSSYENDKTLIEIFDNDDDLKMLKTNNIAVNSIVL